MILMKLNNSTYIIITFGINYHSLETRDKVTLCSTLMLMTWGLAGTRRTKMARGDYIRRARPGATRSLFAHSVTSDQRTILLPKQYVSQPSQVKDNNKKVFILSSLMGLIFLGPHFTFLSSVSTIFNEDSSCWVED